MTKVVIKRSANQATTHRGDVKAGQVFALVKKDGTVSKKLYAAVGNNGKLFSVNLDTGALASTADENRKVAVIGKFVVETRYVSRYEQKSVARSQVKSGEIFHAKGKDTPYLSLGTLSDGRWASINMKNPMNDNYAVGNNGDAQVVVIGSGTLAAQVAA